MSTPVAVFGVFPFTLLDALRNVFVVTIKAQAVLGRVRRAVHRVIVGDKAIQFVPAMSIDGAYHEGCRNRVR